MFKPRDNRARNFKRGSMWKYEISNAVMNSPVQSNTPLTEFEWYNLCRSL